MDPKVEALAVRLKALLDEHEAGRRAQAAARDARQAEARAARAALLEDLAGFGAAVGHLDVSGGEERVELGWAGHRLAFVAEGPADAVRVHLGRDETGEEAAPSPVQIRRDSVGDWVLAVSQDGVEYAEPLFDRGLVHLLVEGLELPVPKPEPRVQPALDDLVPRD